MKKITLVIFIAFLAINCSNDDVIVVSNPTINKTILVEKLNEMNYDLWNKDSKIIGDLKVYDDHENVYISCQTNVKFQIVETAFYLGTYEKLPLNQDFLDKSAFTHSEELNSIETSESPAIFYKVKKSRLQTDENGCLFISTYFTVKNLESNKLERALCVSNHLPKETKSTYFLYCIH